MAKKTQRGPHSEYWMKKDDKLWRVMIRIVHGGVCFVCGKPGANAHHIIGKKAFAFRHGLLNGIYLCVRHHKFDPYLSAHENAPAFGELLRMTNPVQWRYALRNSKRKNVPYDFIKTHEQLEDFLKLPKILMDARLAIVKQMYEEET